ncbi:MAG: LptF/LptG family permease [Arcobacteraceae bacterium]|nr:LptF/LptG family permease [Arcobacteraceae bacterium]
MSILQKYIFSKYLKLFLIILFSLELFFVIFEFVQNLDAIPSSANLVALYIFYNAIFTLTIALPLSLVFAWIVMLIIMIRNNEIISIFSLGSRKRNLFLPVITINLLAILTLVALQSSPLAYAYEKKKQILEGDYFSSLKEDIFVKYDNFYVYFKKLYPLENRAEDIEIFELSDKDLLQSISAKKAYFQNNRWYVIDANIIKKPKEMDFDKTKLEYSYEKFIYTLDGFKPKILDNVYTQNANYSIIDALEAYFVLSKQGVNTDKIRAIIYYQTIIPLFAIPLVFMYYMFISMSNRFFEPKIYTSATIFGTLFVWGGFFLFYKFGISGVILPELALVLPFVILCLVAYLIYLKKSIPS